MDGKALSQQAVGDLNNDSIALPSSDSGSRGHAIDGDHQLPEAIRGLILVLYIPFITPDFRLNSSWYQT